jgi:hypothetical protein
MMHDGADTVKQTRAAAPNLYAFITFADAATSVDARFHRSTRLSSRPMVSMNSSTISSTTERVGRTRSREPTT